MFIAAVCVIFLILQSFNRKKLCICVGEVLILLQYNSQHTPHMDIYI